MRQRPAGLDSDLSRRPCCTTKLCNVRNGITPRRFAAVGNRPLARLITESIGKWWLVDLYELRGLAPLADDLVFQERWREVRLTAKRHPAAIV
ncbi:MAG: glycogen/starch/alpha-glucan phosphorylase [Acetobacteraceae bacterium]|nr:glycogen/starch/alpha-glucan phosphorylase [Acetobacteraceae bacterium]